MTDPKTEARMILDGMRKHTAFLNSQEQDAIVDAIATALAVRDAELAEAASALWRIPPNVHTIPCEANGFAEPDPFEGVGETYADAYMREKTRADSASALLSARIEECAVLKDQIAVKDVVLDKAVQEIERLKNLVGDPEGTAAHAETFLARAERAEAQLAETRKALERERNQLRDKLHCMCGSPIDHSAWEGHTPVSVYDYSLDQERSRAEAAEARVTELEKALNEIIAIDRTERKVAEYGHSYVQETDGPLAVIARRALEGGKEDD